MTKKTINERFKDVRLHFRLTGQEMAEKVGFKTFSNIYLIENGKKSVSGAVTEALVKEFGVNPTWLITGEGSMFLNNNEPQTEPTQEGTKKEATLNPEKGGMYMLINKLEERYKFEIDHFKDELNELKKENERLWVLISNSNLGKDYAPNFTGVAFANQMIA